MVLPPARWLDFLETGELYFLGYEAI
jgi:hypothetical protein